MPTEDKRTLRQRYLKMRRALSKESVEQKSYTINQKIIAQITDDIRSIMFYVPINNEVDVLPLLKQMFMSGRNICLPRLINDRIVPYVIHDLDYDLIPGAYNIPEPDTEPFDGKIDMILVPGVVFDTHGYRIGYGKGYFDRFLFQQKAGIVAGVGYDFQVVNKIEHQSYDYRLHRLFTITKSYKFK